jgi:hypothetical protein
MITKKMKIGDPIYFFNEHNFDPVLIRGRIISHEDFCERRGYNLSQVLYNPDDYIFFFTWRGEEEITGCTKDKDLNDNDSILGGFTDLNHLKILILEYFNEAIKEEENYINESKKKIKEIKSLKKEILKEE